MSINDSVVNVVHFAKLFSKELTSSAEFSFVLLDLFFSFHNFIYFLHSLDQYLLLLVDIFYTLSWSNVVFDSEVSSEHHDGLQIPHHACQTTVETIEV